MSEPERDEARQDREREEDELVRDETEAAAAESEQDPATYGEGDAVRSTETEEDTEGGSPGG
jgi:hypothetical protein